MQGLKRASSESSLGDIISELHDAFHLSNLGLHTSSLLELFFSKKKLLLY